jgi:diguanylate cyclase (GGDEF)-like protein/hemerythrin-like metal-binding protein
LPGTSHSGCIARFLAQQWLVSMTLPTSDPPALTAVRGAGLLEAFMEFPQPLALFDRDGRIDLANDCFMQEFGLAGIREAWLGRLEGQGDDGWARVQLPSVEPGAAVVHARVLRMTNHLLLIVDQVGQLQRDREVEGLRRRLAEVARIATTDYLTGAWNRTHFHQVIQLELARSTVSHQPLALVLFDVDHFKSINDRYGHVQGDGVLRELANVVRHRLRASDALFRWGGEEFVVLISCGYANAERVAENVRAAVENHAFETVGRVTISLGVAEHDAEEDVHRWFERLDAALYMAKTAGRNRVMVDRRGNSDLWARRSKAHLLHLIWQQVDECGHAELDAEHRELFRLANTLIDRSFPYGRDSAEVLAACDELITHVRAHFEHEEEMLARMRYPQLEEHKRAHAGLLRRASKMREMLIEGRARPRALIQFLAEEVVARHLLDVDRAFFPLFTEFSVLDVLDEGLR